MLDGLGAAVRAKLFVEVARVCPDRVHRQGHFGGDLRHGQVGRQVAQHADLAIGDRVC
jgi:hypothetical protein